MSYHKKLIEVALPLDAIKTRTTHHGRPGALQQSRSSTITQNSETHSLEIHVGLLMVSRERPVIIEHRQGE